MQQETQHAKNAIIVVQNVLDSMLETAQVAIIRQPTTDKLCCHRHLNACVRADSMIMDCKYSV